MANKKSLVSIIIPIYNADKYISRCMDSILKQTYNNLEIILIDDGSSDNSPKICDEYAKRDKRITVYHKTNGGSGTARNLGLDKANGNFIMFIDSDDYIESNTIEKMVAEAINGYDIVCVGFDRVDEKTSKVYSKEMINLPFDQLELTKSNLMESAFLSPACWGKLFTKEIIKNVRFTNNTIEDIIFFVEMIPEVSKIKFIKEIQWHYMVNSESLIMTIKEKNVDNFENDLINLKQRYSASNYGKEYFDYLTLQAVIHNCISLPSRLYNNNECNITKRIRHIKKYMNSNFPNWKKLKIRIKGRFIKKIAIHTIIIMYQLGMFRMFLAFYNFCINKLKIDVKW